jgi:DNA (cytosine-5)-methyltransferase 1
VRKLRVLSLFAGIGGFDLGLERTGGFETVAFCEINPFCQRVLAKHWPGVPCYDDVSTLTGGQVGPVDVICGGFPCQDISVAGDGLGLAGERSGLWREYNRLIRELRPRVIIVENVSALLCRGLGDVLGDLAEGGYDAEWDCIPAAAIGAPHIRDRVWIVAYAREERAEGRWPSAFPRLAGVPWGENVRRAAVWAGRPDLPASGLCRGSDGIPARVDRTGALGNAVHPDIPELIGRAILASLAIDQAEAA